MVAVFNFCEIRLAICTFTVDSAHET